MKAKTTAKPAKKLTVKLQTESFLGRMAPDLNILSSSGQSVNLAKLTEQKIILYFYPKDDTPGCTVEGQEFTTLLPEFKKAGYVVYGVSRDSVQSHVKFICKYDYKFELLSDSEEKLCRFFDVIKEKNMYGKKVFGIERSTFIINDGKITKEYRKVKAEGHAALVLQGIN